MALQEEAFDSGTPLFALIKRAEDRAKRATDPENFNFLDHLNSGGVVMPQGDLIIYTNVRASALIQELRAEFDGRVAQQDADEHARVLAEREARFVELAEELTVDEHYYIDTPEGDVDGLGDERVEREMSAVDKLRLMNDGADWKLAVAQVEDELPFPSSIIPDSVAHIPDRLVELAKEIWDGRIELKLEGMQPAQTNKYEDVIQAERYNRRVRELTAEHQLEFINTRRAHEQVAACVKSIHIPATGKTDDFTVNKMPSTAAAVLCASLPPAELNKLIEMCNVLTHAAAIVDPQVDAGFPL